MPRRHEESYLITSGLSVTGTISPLEAAFNLYFAHDIERYLTDRASLCALTGLVLLSANNRRAEKVVMYEKNIFKKVYYI